MINRVVKQQVNLTILQQTPSFENTGAVQYTSGAKTFLPQRYDLKNFQIDAIDFTSIGYFLAATPPTQNNDLNYGANYAIRQSVYLTLFDGNDKIVLYNYPLIDLLNNVYTDLNTNQNIQIDSTKNKLRLFNIKGINPTLSYITIPFGNFFTTPSNYGTLNIYQFA